MPSPIGHALGGIAAATLVGRRAFHVPSGGRRVSAMLLFAVLGMLPDIDLLVFGSHRHATHSFVAAGIVGLLAVAVAPGRPRVWLATVAAYSSHLLLDWLGTDTTAPFGIMALWPFSATHLQSPYHWFSPVCRQFWLLECWMKLAWAVWFELLIIGPLAAAGLLLTRPRRTPTGAGEGE